MIKFIDGLLNRTTMYRLVLYYLIFLLSVALIFSVTGVLAYQPAALLLTTSFLLAVCAGSNWIFARTFGVSTNVESTYITALILALIITPIQSYNDLWFLGWASVLAMGSKYILAIKGKHLFNPVALAVAVTYFATDQSASWWVGSASMLPFVLMGGLLIVMKIRRFDLVISFGLTALIAVLTAALFNGDGVLATLQRSIFDSPLVFFAFVLLTEPLTTPATRKYRIIYGVLVGLLFTPLMHLGSFYTTPELALVIGNIYSYLVSPKTKLVLKLKEKTRIAPDIYEFVFGLPQRFAFSPGQYMEWTLGHNDPDNRGNRRYFTLASAPTEGELRLGIKLYQNPSSFKQALVAMDGRNEIVASQLAGEFVLPNDPRQKCIFIAGGIGITPFRSMIKFLIDTHRPRPIILFYANKRIEEIIYKDIFDQAEKELGIRTYYSVSEPRAQPVSWQGKIGRISPQWIAQIVPDFREYIFYLSGPIGMINSFKHTLRQLGIKDSQIKIDYFSGLS